MDNLMENNERIETTMSVLKDIQSKLGDITDKTYALHLYVTSKIHFIREEFAKIKEFSKKNRDFPGNNVSKKIEPVNNDCAFKPVVGYYCWCYMCFTSPSYPFNDSKNLLQETKCAHIFCQECICERIKKCFESYQNLFCPHCNKFLLKIF